MLVEPICNNISSTSSFVKSFKFSEPVLLNLKIILIIFLLSIFILLVILVILVILVMFITIKIFITIYTIIFYWGIFRGIYIISRIVFIFNVCPSRLICSICVIAVFAYIVISFNFHIYIYYKGLSLSIFIRF